jgi:2-hydroxychromene-2-carboxylate isomerase
MYREVEFLFDYSSPFSYLASVQIEGFAKRNGAEVLTHLFCSARCSRRPAMPRR